MTYILLIAISVIVTAIICYFIPKGKIQEKNLQIQQQEQQLQLNIKDKEREYNELKSKFQQEQQNQKTQLREQMQAWEEERSNKNLSFLKAEMRLKEQVAALETKLQSLQELNAQSKEAAQLVEDEIYSNMSNNIEQHGHKLSEKYEKLESELQVHYVDLADQKWDDYAKRSEELDNKILEQENMLDELRSKIAAAVEANKRIEMERIQKDFYRLQLSNIDKEEIQRLRSVEPYLRKREPLNKVIWKVYYEKPYTDLVGRVIGAGRHTGIYKITNIENGMCYVGQANDLAERWKQHIKRGVGADTPTQNKLYPAMNAIGVENFTFEVIEECTSAQLTEREKYWTDFYKAQEFGYSIRKG